MAAPPDNRDRKREPPNYDDIYLRICQVLQERHAI